MNCSPYFTGQKTEVPLKHTNPVHSSRGWGGAGFGPLPRNRVAGLGDATSPGFSASFFPVCTSPQLMRIPEGHSSTKVAAVVSKVKCLSSWMSALFHGPEKEIEAPRIDQRSWPGAVWPHILWTVSAILCIRSLPGSFPGSVTTRGRACFLN